MLPALMVIKVLGGAVLRGCKKTKRKLMAHFQLRAGVHSQLRVIPSLFLEEDMEEVSMQHHGRAKQLVVFFGAASIGTRGGWGADAVLRACCKVVLEPAA
ncbi:hypothetical protein HaLaN_09201 [Haematococcus lacustris]|uniref:Uncharacterized protein n=1 Tax=Haematococcus lacustris TaxID=44745 RepID=A0A699Z242_HAELA|nr:hypothetical protein HaLaN_09201 [Haematococcus lacustris]